MTPQQLRRWRLEMMKWTISQASIHLGTIPTGLEYQENSLTWCGEVDHVLPLTEKLIILLSFLYDKIDREQCLEALAEGWNDSLFD